VLLTKLTLRDFRCYAEVTDAPLHRLTVFIGENDAGKSGLVDAIRFLLTAAVPGPDDYRLTELGVRAHSIVIAGTFHLEDHDRVPEDWCASETSTLTVTKTWTGGSLRCEVEGRTFADPRYSAFDKQTAAVQKELLDALGVHPAGNTVERAAQLAEVIASGKLCKQAGRLEISFGALSPHLPRFEAVDSADYRDPDGMVQRTMRGVVDAYVRPEKDGEQQLIEPLARVQRQITDALNGEADRIADVLRRTHPKLRRVEIAPSFDFARAVSATNLLIDLGDGLHPVAAFGEGTKKKLWMGLLDWERTVQPRAPAASVLRAYDEPNVNLDYAAERKLFANVLDATRAQDARVQAVVCTHSMTLVDRAPAESINLIRVGEHGERSIEHVAGDGDDEVKAFLTSVGRTVGLTNSAFFYERAFLVVEGESEDAALPLLYRHLYRRAPIEDGVVIINMFTCSAWKAVLRLLQRYRADRTIMLLDSDCEAEDSSGYITPAVLHDFGFPSTFVTDQCFYVGTKELEDAFSTDDILAVLNESWPRDGGALWTDMDVDQFRAVGVKFSEELLTAVWRGRGPRRGPRIRKPEFAQRMAEHCTTTAQIPSKIRDAFEAVRRCGGH